MFQKNIAAIHAFTEKTLEEICSYCKKEHEAELTRTFYLNFMYRTGTCTQCNHEISIRDN